MCFLVVSIVVCVVFVAILLVYFACQHRKQLNLKEASKLAAKKSEKMRQATRDIELNAPQEFNKDNTGIVAGYSYAARTSPPVVYEKQDHQKYFDSYIREKQVGTPLGVIPLPLVTHYDADEERNHNFRAIIENTSVDVDQQLVLLEEEQEKHTALEISDDPYLLEDEDADKQSAFSSIIVPYKKYGPAR